MPKDSTPPPMPPPPRRTTPPPARRTTTTPPRRTTPPPTRRTTTPPTRRTTPPSTRRTTTTPPRRTTPPPTRRTTTTTSSSRGATTRSPTPPTSRPRQMIRILQRQWTISSIIFNFPSSGDFSFSNKQTGTTLVTHRPVIFGSLSFYFLLSASFEPLPTFFSLFNFSTDLTDSGPLREQNSQGGLWESREVQQQTGHLLSSHSIFKHSTKCQSPGEWKICALS